MSHSPRILELIGKLQEKYAAMGQDMESYLEGLLYADVVTYWDYVHLDTLLSLQVPKTNIPDEQIFIMYHQITELYFKLVLSEQQQLREASNLNSEEFLMRIKRMNRYFNALAHSFDIMSEGMEQQQFLQFRMSLLPASGFQSAQYRMIEIAATDFINLVEKDERQKFVGKMPDPVLIEDMYEFIYWKKGATELATGKKTLTLKMFEDKYGEQLIKYSKSMLGTNLWQLYKKLTATPEDLREIQTALREFDLHVNVNWPLAHYKTAVRYLQRNPADIAATGGTNWQKYLPPRFQKRIFYPELWSQEEMDEWGKSWVKSIIN